MDKKSLMEIIKALIDDKLNLVEAINRKELIIKKLQKELAMSRRCI